MSDSKPLMFIDSISKMKETDNSINKRSVSLNRLDDIKAMLYYKMNILVEVKTKNTLTEGVVKSVDNDGLKIDSKGNIINIRLDEIENINILKL